MNSILTQLTDDPWGRLVFEYLVTGGLENGLVSLLVLVRLSGVFVISPWLMSVKFPLPVRLGLVMILTCVIAPLAWSRHGAPEVGRALLSSLIVQNQDGAMRDTRLFDLSSRQSPVGTADSSEAKTGGTDWGVILFSEIAVGTLLGTGILIIFLGLKLGGEWLDRYSGLGLARTFNPEISGDDSACGQISMLMGIVAFVLLEPLNGQALALKSLIDSFASLPPGAPFWTEQPVETIIELIQQSLVLGIRIGIPLAATMLLVDLTLALCSRNSQLPLSGSLYLIRGTLGLVMLALTLTAIPEVIVAATTSLL
ncbi:MULTISPECIES: flagellar biosynthetic protein FliR [unclassified Schlesneria]|uniref:flagellar biosynthetic protein FliR n=1 Tax=unclassified Schlesneria TaxID=2762017 RepID=UPI002F145606